MRVREMPHGVYWGNYITNGFADSIILPFAKNYRY